MCLIREGVLVKVVAVAMNRLFIISKGHRRSLDGLQEQPISYIKLQLALAPEPCLEKLRGL